MDALAKLAFEQAVKDFYDNEGLYIEQCQVAAKILKNYYDSLVDKGFTSYQALQIVMAHGTNIGKLSN